MNKIREDISKWPIEKRAKKLQEIFLQRMGYPLDLKHPRHFSEMQQWCKLYYHDPRITECVDKVTFKDYVKRVLGTDAYTAKLITVWHSPDEVSFDDLPQQCVIKSNCSSDGHNLAIVTDKSKLDWLALALEIKTHWFDRLGLHTNSFASYYYSVEPAVIVEEYLPALAGEQNEFKILYFHGKPQYVAVPGYEWKDGKKDKFVFNSFYSLDWKCQHVKYGRAQGGVQGRRTKARASVRDARPRKQTRLGFSVRARRLHRNVRVAVPHGAHVRFGRRLGTV